MPNQVAFADNSKLARNKTPTLRITRRIKQAIEYMIEHKSDYDVAARENGLTTRAMRLALERPHVRSYINAQLDVLRNARVFKNHFRLCDIADAEDNMPAVNAIKAMMQISDEQTNKTTHASPGVTINIVHAAAPVQHEQTINATELQLDQTND